MLKTWVLFKRQDNKIGVIPKGLPVKGEIVEEFNGTIEDACIKAEQIEFASASCS